MRAFTPVTEFTQTEVARDGQSALLLSLRFLRGDRSLEEVAGQAGIRADELSRIERGLTKQIRWETLLRLMRTYECRPDELLEVRENTSGTGLGTPREFMLAAIEAGVGGHVPTRRLQLDATSTGLNEAAEADLAAPVQGGSTRRKFEPESTH